MKTTTANSSFLVVQLSLWVNSALYWQTILVTPSRLVSGSTLYRWQSPKHLCPIWMVHLPLDTSAPALMSWLAWAGRRPWNVLPPSATSPLDWSTHTMELWSWASPGWNSGDNWWSPKIAPPASCSWTLATPEQPWCGHPSCALQHCPPVVPGMQSLSWSRRTCAASVSLRISGNAITPHADLPGSLKMSCQWHTHHPSRWWRSPRSVQTTLSSWCTETLQGRLTGQRAFGESETDHTWW